MITKEIPKEEYIIALNIYNESFNKENTHLNLSLLGELIGLYLNNTLIGIAQIDYLNDIMDNKKYAIINSFCIKKEYRNNGYGNYFLKECIKYLRKKKIDCINMRSNKNRIIAHKIYEKNSFKEVNTILLKKDL